MKVHKISKKLIKPDTPTAQNLKNYKISMLDQFMESMNMGVILFYESKPEKNTQLEESLATILVEFYLLAGRYMKNDHFVDCNDDGAEFVEAEAQGVAAIMDVAATTNSDQLNLNDLLPDQYFRADEAPNDPLLSIQATHFPCGGIAIAISISHRVFDMPSFAAFTAAWSKACSNPDHYYKAIESTSRPSFSIPSLLPYMDLGLATRSNKCITEADEISVKRLVFDKDAITRLRSKIAHNVNDTVISGVSAVCAVIVKALMEADRAKHGGRSRGLFIIQPIDMRERTIPPQPKHVCGNLTIPSLTRRVDSGNVVGMGELVDVMDESVGRSIGEYSEILVSPSIIMNALRNIRKQVFDPETNVIAFTDWSEFGFYDADFGWGKPVWASIGPQPPAITATVIMSDGEGNGIEAWLHLKQSDVAYFDQVEEIKLFTT
ncbi:hypothetical protein C2S53_010100 [Perilla frutescens var. hirtella]|uniref:Transferase, Chloramphenicol acetyltransferase-like domain protein n=1 Tax=Perilla frutescens var. hirtella TaxID=608512 RepID=A0AAD4JBC6_PERFH|nr:hypothetical protein C2S53_010100 [Perilla frutescens var. hirtella]